MSSPGNELLGVLRAAAMELLSGLAVPEVGNLLDGLEQSPPPAWSGHALEGQMLGRITPGALAASVNHLGARAALQRLDALVGESDSVGLFGRKVGVTKVPVLAAQAGSGPDRLVALIGLRTDGQAGLEAVVAGNASPIPVTPTPGVSFTLTAHAPGPFAVVLPASGPAGVTGNAPGASLRLDVDLEAPQLPALDGGPSLTRGALHFTMRLRADQPAPVVDASIALPGVTASLLPALIRKLAPKFELPQIDITIATDPKSGLVLQGDASLDVPVPGTGTVGLLDVRTLRVGLGASVDAGGPRVRATVSADIAISLPGAPVTLLAEHLSVESVFALTSGVPPTVSAPDLGGLGATVELPIASGAGVLRHEPTGDWVGAVALKLPPMSVGACGIFREAANGGGPSFLVVLGARFPPPGIQIGFGFAVSGIGGIFGVDRRADTDALTAAVFDGSLGSLMFPDDPVSDASRIAKNLPRLFPSAPGRVLFGPMFELNWSGGMARGQVALLMELPAPVRVIILGRLLVDLPHAELSIVHLEVGFMASVDIDVPELRVVASLAGSRIVGLALTGDIFLLVRGGASGQMLFSAGGFHPAFRAPDGVPALRRLGTVATVALIELSYQAYLALTPASAQFGARIEVRAEVADCGVHGWFGFDALFEWAPKFRFSASFSAGVEVEVLGESLLGVRLDGLLEGPAPWHIRARGEIELLFVSVSLTIDETFGDEPRAIETAPNVAGELERELAKMSSWAMHPPAADRDGVSLSQHAAAAMADGRLLHPAGSVTVRQKLVPFDIAIDRFGGHRVPPQLWSVTGVRLHESGNELPPAELLQDQFALVSFRAQTVEEQLAGASFEEHASGARLSPDGVSHPPVRSTDLGWETIVLAPDVGGTRLRKSALDSLRGDHPDLFRLLAEVALSLPWPEIDAPVVHDSPDLLVVPDDPLVGLVAAGATAGFSSSAAARDAVMGFAVAGQRALVVEAWELG